MLSHYGDLTWASCASNHSVTQVNHVAKYESWALETHKMKHFKYESTAAIHWNFTRTLAQQTMENSSQWHCEGLFNSLFNIALKKPKLYYITCPLWGESTSHQWIPHTKGQSLRKHFHVISPCHESWVLSTGPLWSESTSDRWFLLTKGE